MTWIVALQFIKRFGPYLAIFALLLGLYAWGYSRGASKWKTRAEAAEKALNRAEAGWESSRNAVAICNEQTLEFTSEAAARQAQLEKELDKKPEVIVKYIERVETIENTITSKDCAVALSQAADVLKGVVAP